MTIEIDELGPIHEDYHEKFKETYRDQYKQFIRSKAIEGIDEFYEEVKRSQEEMQQVGEEDKNETEDD